MLAKSKGKKGEPAVIENRRARHEYHILTTVEAGIALLGSEVKSVREGKVSLSEGYVRAEESPASLTLHGVTIQEYGPAAGHQHSPKRARTLLAHKKEIVKLARESSQKGFTIVPLKMYFKGARAKVLVGVARGKAEFDKRATKRDMEAKRELARVMRKRV